MEHRENNLPEHDAELEQILSEARDMAVEIAEPLPRAEAPAPVSDEPAVPVPISDNAPDSGKKKMAREKKEKQEKTSRAADSKKAAEEKKGSGLLPDLIALLLRVGWIAFVFAVLLLVVCGITVNNGNRMAPSFHDRDVVIYYRLARDIEAGEVVVYQAENGRLLVGRVIAAAGDAVDIDEKGVRINGYYQAELYARGDTVLFEGGTALPVTLGTGEYFILCDDRSQSSDSRTFGPVPESRIKGRVMLMIRQRDF